MLKVTNGEINLTRGDSGVIECKVYYADGETEYVLQPGDEMLFTVRSKAKGLKYDDILIQLEFVNGKIYISPNDTAELSYGTYVYDVELQFDNGDINTIVPYNLFVLSEEVT